MTRNGNLLACFVNGHQAHSYIKIEAPRTGAGAHCQREVSLDAPIATFRCSQQCSYEAVQWQCRDA